MNIIYKHKCRGLCLKSKPLAQGLILIQYSSLNCHRETINKNSERFPILEDSAGSALKHVANNTRFK